MINPLERICTSYSSYRNLVHLGTKQDIFLNVGECALGEYYNIQGQPINIILEEGGIYECILEKSIPNANYNSDDIFLLPNHTFYYNEFTNRSILRNQTEFNSQTSAKDAFAIGLWYETLNRFIIFNIKNNKNILKIGGGKYGSSIYVGMYTSTLTNIMTELKIFGTIYYSPNKTATIELMRLLVKRII